MIAYTLGIMSFLLAESLKTWRFIPAQRLGEIGFTFFLAAKLPIDMIRCFVDFDSSLLMEALGWVTEFVTAVLLARVVTVWLERPLLQWAKKAEKRL